MTTRLRQSNRLLRTHFSRVVRDLKQELVPEDETIVDAFLNADRHVTEQELQDLVGDPAIDLSHVRRALRLLCDLGIAQPIRLDGQVYYEHLHLDNHHDHLVCVRCGSIVEFVDPGIEALQRESCQAFGFTPLMHKLEIRGVCRACAAALPATRSLSVCLRGETVEVVEVLGGQALKHRLQAMGLTRGTVLTVLGGAGPVVLDLRGTRTALGRNEAAKVIVRQRPPQGGD